jgi:predicted nucleic acid-binding protein
MYLIDTNVLSEMSKRSPHEGVSAWFESVHAEQLWVSVLVLGEIRAGIANRARRDARAAARLGAWLDRIVAAHKSRILPVTRRVADVWGPLNVPDRLPAIDGLLAATAIVHDLTLVTRNVREVARTGVRVLNPFDSGALAT